MKIPFVHIAAGLVLTASAPAVASADCGSDKMAEWDSSIHDVVNGGNSRTEVVMQSLMGAQYARACASETSAPARYSWHLREGVYYSVAAVNNMDAGNRSAARGFFQEAISALQLVNNRAAAPADRKGALRSLKVARGLLHDLR
jgi:hypothetical protein